MNITPKERASLSRSLHQAAQRKKELKTREIGIEKTVSTNQKIETNTPPHVLAEKQYRTELRIKLEQTNKEKIIIENNNHDLASDLDLKKEELHLKTAEIKQNIKEAEKIVDELSTAINNASKLSAKTKTAKALTSIQLENIDTNISHVKNRIYQLKTILQIDQDTAIQQGNEADNDVLNSSAQSISQSLHPLYPSKFSTLSQENSPQLESKLEEKQQILIQVKNKIALLNTQLESVNNTPEKKQKILLQIEILKLKQKIITIEIQRIKLDLVLQQNNALSTNPSIQFTSASNK